MKGSLVIEVPNAPKRTVAVQTEPELSHGQHLSVVWELFSHGAQDRRSRELKG